MTDAGRTLERTVADLASGAGGSWLQLGEPRDDGWWSLTAATRQAPGWHAELAAAKGDRRAAAAFLAAWLARAPALTVGLPAILGGVAPSLAQGQPWLHRHPDGWFDAHAIAPLEVTTGALPDVLAAAGRQVAAATAPIVDALCAALPIGRTAVWGGVADGLCAFALRAARQLHPTERETWERCQVFLDAVERAAPVPFPRPRASTARAAGGTDLAMVRGTCCLHYRTCGASDRGDDGYCLTCPLRAEHRRTVRG